MNVLVTGATGFIGSAVVARLVARGDTVTGIDRTVAWFKSYFSEWRTENR